MSYGDEDELLDLDHSDETNSWDSDKGALPTGQARDDPDTSGQWDKDKEDEARDNNRRQRKGNRRQRKEDKDR